MIFLVAPRNRGKSESITSDEIDKAYDIVIMHAENNSNIIIRLLSMFKKESEWWSLLREHQDIKMRKFFVSQNNGWQIVSVLFVKLIGTNVGH